MLQESPGSWCVVYTFSKEVTKVHAQTFPHRTPSQNLVSLIWTLTLVPTLWTISASFLACIASRVLTWDYPNSAIANQESLSGLETEMRKLEGIVKEIVEEMDYLKKREEKFQNTNGACSPNASCAIAARLTEPLVSTNIRVQNFAWFTIVALLALGAWQIMHLRSFFKRKYLID